MDSGQAQCEAQGGFRRRAFVRLQEIVLQGLQAIRVIYNVIVVRRRVVNPGGVRNRTLYNHSYVFFAGNRQRKVNPFLIRDIDGGLGLKN